MTVRYYKYSRNARAAARRVGLDPDVVVQPAPAGFYSVDFGDTEYPDRLVTVAMSPRERILYVVTIERAQRTRIISARRASNHERRIYEGEP